MLATTKAPASPPHPAERPLIGWLLAAGAPLAVFALLGLFAYPTLDDWAFRATALHDGILGGTLAHLQGWGGRFAVIPLNLAIHAVPAQWLMFPAVIIVNILLIAVSMRLLLPTTAPARWPLAAAAAAFLAATLVSHAEVMYWLCGTLAYLFPLHLAAAAVGLMRRWRDRDGWRFGLAIASVGVIIGGFGETVAGLVAASAVLLALGGVRRAWWLVVGSLSGIGLALAMPGTWVRMASGVREYGQTVGAWDALVSSGGQYLGLMQFQLWRPEVWCALLGAALFAARTPSRPPLPHPWLILAGVPAAGILAFAPSFAALGLVEGRQQSAVWLMTAIWLLALAWRLGACNPGWFLGQGRRPGTLAGLALILITCAHAAANDVYGILSLVLGVPAVVLCGLMAVAVLRGGGLPWVVAALAALLWASPSVERAAVDLLVNAPQRRAEQATRDREVARLAAMGAEHVRFPPPDPRYFPAMISMGEMVGPTDWVSQAYARCYRLRSAGSDIRLRTAVATDAAGVPVDGWSVPRVRTQPRLER